MTVLMENPNFLILDEPTNDLDVFVMSVLEDYLRGFQGCLIVVSHDRYFMDKMVDHLFVFKGEGEVKDITGNYTAFRNAEQKLARAEKREESAQATKEEKSSRTSVDNKQEKRKLSYKEKVEFESLEGDMEKLEKEKAELTQILSNPEASNDDLMKAGERLSVVVAELEEKEFRWLELSEYE
jgi:ATP-binding cassette subfamily F protein uup